MHINSLSIKVLDFTKSLVIDKIKNNRLLVITDVRHQIPFFFVLPKAIYIRIDTDDYLSFWGYHLKNLHIYFFSFKKQLTFLKFPFFCKLFLKGLGFKIKLISNDSHFFLELKLGFSQLIRLNIPSKKITVTVKKTSLILSGFCKVDIGNFANQIYNLRKPNVYTAKGFRYKRQRLQLKLVKKS